MKNQPVGSLLVFRKSIVQFLDRRKITIQVFPDPPCRFVQAGYKGGVASLNHFQPERMGDPKPLAVKRLVEFLCRGDRCRNQDVRNVSQAFPVFPVIGVFQCAAQLQLQQEKIDTVQRMGEIPGCTIVRSQKVPPLKLRSTSGVQLPCSVEEGASRKPLLSQSGWFLTGPRPSERSPGTNSCAEVQCSPSSPLYMT